ncbi:PepSY-associated TM helix domain-containing protein [Stenotrophomonas sp. NLF4-10]|uniref:PepSY-associated TM helix domain-containing protein n=1 Tax=Stenotrophomonas sp. NLF4-10 TaxID=2918754 RepID=UPI001EFA4F6F|nr:PepSY-associated TM helix domain-containing protein [Stenotrophomonas sp. NLF4-10]MCG8276338.1 PepSY domain-containing protein [Stenotrophomonas sp. NLF4-10]
MQQGESIVFQSFRQVMAWLHTWFGLVLGFVLMAAFFFGALSVFDREIDRWSIPASRFEPQPMPSFEKVLRPAFERMQPLPAVVDAMRPRVDGPMPGHFDTVAYWSAYTTHRDPVLALYAGYQIPGAKDPEDLVWGEATIDPRDGRVLPDDQLKIGSGFFYPLHYSLTLDWKNLGFWIVGFSALMMLVALVSGVVMHRKLFRELFTFRPGKARLRSVLDLHNLTGVVALPFHFFFAFTGLVIFASTYYFPIGHTQLHDLHELHEKHEAQELGLPHGRAGVPAGLANVDAMVAEAQRRWEARGMAGDVGFLVLQHVGDANGYVSIYRAGTDRIALVGQGIHFKASTGQLLREDPPATAVGRISEFLTGLHLQHFRHWLLRWLYVFGGLAGCVCIATGFVFFVEKRKRQHAKQGSPGVRVVDALAVATVTGMVVATLGLLVANRLLPEALPMRGDWERYAFWGGWLLALLHAAWRSAPVARGLPNPAWREQAWAIAVLAPLAVLLNWITTGDHLLRTLAAGYWPVAGLDLALLAVAVIAAASARRLGRRAEARAHDLAREQQEAAHA